MRTKKIQKENEEKAKLEEERETRNRERDPRAKRNRDDDVLVKINLNKLLNLLILSFKKVERVFGKRQKTHLENVENEKTSAQLSDLLNIWGEEDLNNPLDKKIVAKARAEVPSFILEMDL